VSGLLLSCSAVRTGLSGQHSFDPMKKHGFVFQVYAIIFLMLIIQSFKVTIQPYLTRRLIMLSFRAAARNLERLLMRPKPKIPRVARNDKVR
jgi:hypothetical protein